MTDPTLTTTPVTRLREGEAGPDEEQPVPGDDVGNQAAPLTPEQRRAVALDAYAHNRRLWNQCRQRAGFEAPAEMFRANVLRAELAIREADADIARAHERAAHEAAQRATLDRMEQVAARLEAAVAMALGVLPG